MEMKNINLERKFDVIGYLGDIRNVLYHYVCSLNSDNVSFRCGNFAFNEIKKLGTQGYMEKYNTIEYLDLNGETVMAAPLKELDKKKLIISKGI